MDNNVSREHTTAFLKRERQEIEKLRAEIGTEVVAKIDRPLLRDLIYDRKEADLAKLFGLEPQPTRHRIMVSGASARSAFADAKQPVAAGERQERVAQMQRTGLQRAGVIESDLKAHGAEVLDRFWLTHSVVALASADQVEVAAARGDVASVIADKRYFATTLNISRPLIKADQVANNLHFKGTGITVAIIDTGIDVTHPALSSVPIATRQDFTGEGTGDGFGHGTHCAGIVASQDATFTGIAPGATLAEFKILDNTGSGTSSNAVAGIQAAVTAQVHVASNSWGFSHGGGWVDPNGHCVLCNAADAASAAGVVFVAAAGNEGGSSGGCSTPDTLIRCPGNARTAITVGASDDSDKMASFSSPGPTPDGRTKPDVTGPGVQIASCRATGTQLAASVGPPLDPTSIFIRLDGTSMATPHVAGVAALMLSKPATPTHPPADIKAILMRTAVNIGATANEMGSGRIDALAAVNAS